MPLIQPISNTIDDLLIGLHQDYLINFLSVHDETVQLVDKKLAQPIMLETIKIAELNKLFEQIDLPFISFKFDVEYDDYGSYTAAKGFNISQYDVDTTRKFMGKGFIPADASVMDPPKPAVHKEEIPKVDSNPSVFEYHVKEYDENIITAIQALPPGNDTFVLYVDNTPFTFAKTVDSSYFQQ